MATPRERLPSTEPSGLVRFVNANSRLEYPWDSQRRSFLVMSLVIHGFLVVGLRTWRLDYGFFEPIDPEPAAVLVYLPGGAEAMAVGEPMVVLEFEPELTQPDADAIESITTVVEGPVVTGDDLAPAGDALGEALGDRLRRGRRLVPSLAVPTVAAERRDPGAADAVDAPGPEPEPIEDDELSTIDTDVTTIELADLPASDSLDLGRLTGLRPELAFMTASAWVLIRNQEEVLSFLRRTYRDGVLDPAIQGSVGITLWIDRLGVVEWAEISQSSGRTDLDEVALAVFSEVAEFRPARDRGENVSRSVTFSLNFPW